ncbi:MAG: hypothetical protein V4489_09065 [Chlamydiota bacterium]
MFKNIVQLSIICFYLKSSFLAAEQKECAQQFVLSCPSALRSLSSITCITLSPKVVDGFKTELEKYGQVKEVNPIKETKEGIEIQSLNSDATLMFRVEKVSTTDGKSFPIFQAFLSLETSTTIIKNGRSCNAVVWASHCFFSELSDKEADKESTQKSFSLLMKEFIDSYMGINSTKPTFLMLK